MRLLKLISIIVCFFVGCLLLIELVIRLVSPVSMEPGAAVTLKNEIPGIKETVRYSFDGDRLRKLNWTDERSNNSFRIICFGGNATTTFFQASEDTWWGVLSTQLSKKCGKKVEVAALAKTPNGHQILSSAAKAERILKKYKADLIICCFGVGDTMHYGNYLYDPKKLDALRDDVPRGFKYSLAKKSHLMRMIRNGRTRRYLKQALEPLNELNHHRDMLTRDRQYYASRPVMDFIKRDSNDPLKEYIDGIKAFTEMASRIGSRLLIVGEPSIYKPSMESNESALLMLLFHPAKPVGGSQSGHRVKPEAIVGELDRFYQAAGNYCQESGLNWVNLQGKIPQFPDHFISETEVTDLGAQVMAQNLLTPVDQILNHVK